MYMDGGKRLGYADFSKSEPKFFARPERWPKPRSVPSSRRRRLAGIALCFVPSSNGTA
jgi:hypothetical protein